MPPLTPGKGHIVINVVEPKEIFRLEERRLRMMQRLAVAVAQEREAIHKQFNQFTGTWDHKPAWTKPPLRVSALMISAHIYTGDRIFRFIELGTSVRHAVMSPDFKPKTKPKRVRSVAGVGGKMIVRRSIRMPGIAPREIIPTIMDRRKEKFVAKINGIIAYSLSRRG
jgi:hypothetical protein